MQLELENIGPFKKACLDIGDITIIAGVNDTGKSYLSKILFCFITSQNIDFWSGIEDSFFQTFDIYFEKIKIILGKSLEKLSLLDKLNSNSKDEVEKNHKWINRNQQKIWNILWKFILKKWKINFKLK